MKKQRPEKSVEEKSDTTLRKELNRREENLKDNKIVNDEDSNIGRGKYQSKQGEGRSDSPSTKGGETE